MFKAKTLEERETVHTNDETVIGTSVKLEGDFKSEGDVTVNGEVSGTVFTEGDLTVGETAIVKANVHGKNVLIAGKVEGDVKSQDKVELKASCKVIGNIETSRIEIADGAFFGGECIMGKTSDSLETDEGEA